MAGIVINPIGVVKVTKESQFSIEIAEAFRPALLGLDDFSHVNVFFWCDKCDQSDARSVLQIPKPYKNAPEVLGTFATRSPARPNPLGQTAVQILDLDQQRGLIRLAYIDADDQTPVIDMKPYTPCLDRVREPVVPQWCRHWPKWLEDSGDFDWAGEFTFLEGNQ